MNIISVTENPHLLSRRELESKGAFNQMCFNILQRIIEREEKEEAEGAKNPPLVRKYWDNSIGDFVESET